MVKMSTERSKPLHNFSLPSLRWGNQRYLRCMKVNSNGDVMSGSDHRRSSGSEESDFDLKDFKSPPQPKLVIHLQTSNHNKKNSSNNQDEDESGSAARPWNLRTRRAVCKSPNNESGSSKTDKRPPPPPQQQPPPQTQQNCSFKKPENPSPKSLRLRGLAAMAANQGMPANHEKRREFSRSLTREEIKEDFLAMTGNNPARRPKKRSKIVQKQINNLFPGFWLTEVTTDSYRVADELVDAVKK